MKILLVSPSSDTRFEASPPMGLMNLFLIAQQLGFEVELEDFTCVSHARAERRMLRQRYDIVGVSCSFTSSAQYWMEYARCIKQRYPDTIVVGGGSHATFVPEDLLQNEYDVVFYGEAERSWREFLERVLGKEEYGSIAGTVVMRDGRLIRNPPYPPIGDLDSLPLNDFSQFDLEPYFALSGLRYLHMLTSRGCVFHCAFCSAPRMWQKGFRAKSPERVLAEFRIAKRHGVEFMSMEDDDFAIDEGRVRRICELLIAEGIGIPWSTGIGCRSIRSEDTIALMKRSGCVAVNVSIESANPRILEAYHKPFRIEDNTGTCRRLRSQGILVQNKGIIGFPGETVRESLRTFRYQVRTADMWSLSILEPRPGSDYWYSWDKRGDPSQYPRFGKGNVLLGDHRLRTWVLFRVWAACMLFHPRQVRSALFARPKVVRYLCRKNYTTAYWVLRANLLDWIRQR